MRRLIDLETHREVFQWVLKVLADHDLVSGNTVGYDTTILEANAPMRSIVRKDTKRNYQEFLTGTGQGVWDRDPHAGRPSQAGSDSEKQGQQR